MNWVRNFILLLTTLGAVASVYIKISRDFCIELIKSRYKNVPGQQSIFEIVTVWIMYSIFVLDILMLVPLVTNLLDKFKIGDVIKASSGNNIGIIANIITFLLAIIIVNAILGPILIYQNVKIKFIRKLEGDFVLKITNRIKVWNSISIIAPIFVPAISLIVISYNVKIHLSKYQDNFVFTNNIDEEFMQIIIIILVISFICATSFVIQKSLKELIRSVDENCIYIIKVDNEEIKCNSYLEYKEYYLLFENGMQRYISKNKVKEIKKGEFRNSIIICN